MFSMEYGNASKRAAMKGVKNLVLRNIART